MRAPDQSNARMKFAEKLLNDREFRFSKRPREYIYAVLFRALPDSVTPGSS